VTLAAPEAAVHVTELDVRPYETDRRGLLRPGALLTYLQLAASEHAERLGIPVRILLRSGHTWVLSRLHLQLDLVPRSREALRIRTWPATREAIFSIREFEIETPDGRRYGRATTSWAVLDVATRRPVRLAEALPDYPLWPLRALDDPFATLPPPEPAAGGLLLPVLRSDLDFNGHVNNTVYAGWALEAVPEELTATHRLGSIEIGFRAEAFHGDTIVSRWAPSAEGPHCLLHRIDRETDGRELARLRTRWIELPN
jgi:acyl-ACP thioesterase